MSKVLNQHRDGPRRQHDAAAAAGLLLAFVALSIAFWLHPFITAGAALVLIALLAVINAVRAHRVHHGQVPALSHKSNMARERRASSLKQKTQAIHL